MCGIAGVLALNPTADVSPADTARAMAACLAHRGPDDVGLWESSDHTLALSHRRLAIVDLSALGHNPMSWDNGRLWITFNGEIYNFRELRAELEDLGHRFRSQTDTEVILAAYDQWGLEAVQRLVGMFAFALWDAPRRRLWLVRDRLGKKPIYYSVVQGALRFASELKAIVDDRRVPRDIDRDALRCYFRYGYVPSPLSIYTHVSKLPPAHQLICEGGSFHVSRYWDPLVQARASRQHVSDAEAKEQLETLLATAVRQRMTADVPLGAFLSGGIDSSLVVALMREQSPARVRTFTVRFDDPEYDEADHAAAVAAHLGTEHHEQACTGTEMLECIDRLPAMFDEPFADSSAVPTFLVSKVARQHVTVALSGDGGDELFFGYPRYSFHADAQWLLRQPRALRSIGAAVARRLPTRRLRRIADVLDGDDPDTYARFVSWFAPDGIAEVTGAVAPPAALYADLMARADGLAPAELGPLLDLVSYLPEDILTKVDRASMAVSLEVRAPLLDHRVVEHALALRLDLKRRGATTKWLLREILASRVPAVLTDRPKAGFGVPLERWFRGPLRADMDRAMAGPDLEALGLDPRPLRQLWSEFVAGANRRADLIWQVFMLVAWARRR